MPKTNQNNVKLIPDETIIRKIYVIRGHKVMLDFDLAALYEVETRVLNQAVKRNIDRFPKEFMFRLTAKEWQSMRSQFVIASSQNDNFQSIGSMQSQIVTASKKELMLKNVTSSQRKRNINVTPYAFTEHGVAMIANVLKSERAIKMSIVIIKTFIHLTKQVLDYSELAEQIKALKLHLGEHDAQLNSIYEAIENLLDEKAEKKSWEDRKRIGFK
jgi:cell division protein FtsB